MHARKVQAPQEQGHCSPVKKKWKKAQSAPLQGCSSLAVAAVFDVRQKKIRFWCPELSVRSYFETHRSHQALFTAHIKAVMTYRTVCMLVFGVMARYVFGTAAKTEKITFLSFTLKNINSQQWLINSRNANNAPS